MTAITSSIFAFATSHCANASKSLDGFFDRSFFKTDDFNKMEISRPELAAAPGTLYSLVELLPMLCSLCKRDADQVIRVDGWQVCQWCVSNKVLEHAIDVRTNVKKLTVAVSDARITHQQDAKRVREAQDRLHGIYADLETAIKDLAAVSEESQKSLAKSLGVVEALREYQALEANKTREARNNKN